VSPTVAVVGAGAWGKNHVRTLNELGALAGVVEASESLRERVHHDYPGIRVWSSIEQALPHVPAFVIATPAASHVALASIALDAGKGVLIEKPMALEVEGAQALVHKADAGRHTLMVGHLLIYQPAIAKLKELLDQGIIGKVYRIHQERLNFGRVRETESVLWSLGPHDVAVLMYLLGGHPEPVQAAGSSYLQPGIQDDVHLELGFADGCSAHIHVAWYWPEQRRGLKVMGETGMIVYDEASQTLTLHRKRLAGGTGVERLALVDDGVVSMFAGHGQPLLLEDQHFLTCLESGAKPLSDGQSGLDVIRVLQLADAQLTATGPSQPKEPS
jgi:predicted dehydrogenase